jgi:hypothetical protein
MRLLPVFRIDTLKSDEVESICRVTRHCVSAPPLLRKVGVLPALQLVSAAPLEPHLALKNMRVSKNAHYRVLGSEVCQALPRDASGVPVLRFFCAICSHRLLARSSPRVTNVSARGPFLASSRSTKLRMQTLCLKLVLRHDTEGVP